MKTKLLKIDLVTALTVFMTGGLLFGAIKMIDETQTDTPDCEKRIQHECPLKKEGQLPDCCPNPRPPCPLNRAK